MNKKVFFTLIIMTFALAVYNSKLPAAQAQRSNPTGRLAITGLVENPMNLTLDDMKAMPQTTEYAVLVCVGFPSAPLEQGNWTGVELPYLLRQANVSSAAIKVALFATDGFMTDFTVEKAMQGSDILVAYQKDNVSLGDLQLVVPSNWGYKWISNLTRIQLVNYNFLGTYESVGYADDGQSVPQGETSTPTVTPTLSLTTSPTASNPKPSTFLVYIAAISVITVIAAVASAVILTKRARVKKSKCAASSSCWFVPAR